MCPRRGMAVKQQINCRVATLWFVAVSTSIDAWASTNLCRRLFFPLFPFCFLSTAVTFGELSASPTVAHAGQKQEMALSGDRRSWARLARHARLPNISSHWHITSCTHHKTQLPFCALGPRTCANYRPSLLAPLPSPTSNTDSQIDPFWLLENTFLIIELPHLHRKLPAVVEQEQKQRQKAPHRHLPR